MDVILTCTQAGGILVCVCRQVSFYVWYLGVYDGSIFGYAAELIVS